MLLHKDWRCSQSFWGILRILCNLARLEFYIPHFQFVLMSSYEHFNSYYWRLKMLQFSLLSIIIWHTIGISSNLKLPFKFPGNLSAQCKNPDKAFTTNKYPFSAWIHAEKESPSIPLIWLQCWTVLTIMLIFWRFLQKVNSIENPSQASIHLARFL